MGTKTGLWADHTRNSIFKKPFLNLFKSTGILLLIMALAKEQTAEIREKLDTLEQMDSSLLTYAAMDFAFGEMHRIIDSYGVPDGHGYRKMLKSIEKRMRKASRAPDRKIVYEGVSDRSRLRVVHLYDHIFFERVYGSRIKMSWRFSSYGRVDRIDAMLFPSNRIRHLMTVLGYRALADWTEALAYYLPRVPAELSCLNPEVREQPHAKRCQSLMRYGHSMAGGVINNCNKGLVEDSIRREARSLADIVKNHEASEILARAGQLLPSVVPNDEETVAVLYRVR